MYVKISNLIQKDGLADYKGLDLGFIERGTQLYPYDDNCAYFFYEGEVSESEDVQFVTEEEYGNIKSEIEAMRPENPIETLQKQQNLMQKALDDMIFGGGF